MGRGLAYIEANTQKRSLERDGYSVQHLYKIIGNNRVINTLTASDVYAYRQARLQANAAPGTINREIGLLSAALNWGRQVLGWDIPNPAQGQRLTEPAGRDRWLTPEEAARLIAAAGQEPQAPHLPDFIRLAIHTGMRSGELLEFEWPRVDLQQDRILLGAEHQKNGKPGSVPLNRTARLVIVSRARFRAEYCPASPWVFCDRQGQRIASVKKGFASAVRRAGIAHCTPHDLRRTCGSWLVQARVPIQEVARLLRHSDIRVTERVYAHLLPDQIRGTVAALDRHDLVTLGDDGTRELQVTD